MTPKQLAQFNFMRYTLRKIAKDYQTPDQLRKNAEREYGVSYEEALEMAYENIQQEAANAIRGVRVIVEKQK